MSRPSAEQQSKAEDTLLPEEEQAHMGMSRCRNCGRYWCDKALACSIRADWQDRGGVSPYVTVALAAAVEALEEAAADEGARQAELAAEGGL